MNDIATKKVVKSLI